MTGIAESSLLQRLEAQDACERLALDYSFHADTGDWERWSGLFADDGEMHLSGAILKGPSAIRKAVAGAPATLQTVHAITNHRVEITGKDDARGSVYVTVYMAERKTTPPAEVAQVAPAIVGVYHDHYRRTADGWKFRERRFEPMITASTSRDASANQGE